MFLIVEFALASLVAESMETNVVIHVNVQQTTNVSKHKMEQAFVHNLVEVVETTLTVLLQTNVALADQHVTLEQAVTEQEVEPFA